MNRRAILRAVRAKGYQGNTQAKSIIDWLEGEGIELATSDGSVLDAKAIETALAKTVTISVSADAGEEVRVQDASQESEDGQLNDEIDEEEEEDEQKSAPKPRKKRELSKSQKATQRIMREERANTPGILDPERRKAYRLYEERAKHRHPITGRRKTVFADAETAERFGATARLALAGPWDYSQKANDMAIIQKAATTTDNGLGGAFTFDDYAAELINLQELYGVARQIISFRPLTGNVLTFPRKTSRYTVYNIGEGASFTESDIGTDNVSVIATKLGCYGIVSSEMMNDSAINFADLAANEIAQAFAESEDDFVFNGDGSSTYFGFTGIRTKLLDYDGGGSDATASLQTASGNAYSEIILSDFNALIGKLPEYADNGAAWVCSKVFYASVMQKLEYAAGGNTKPDIEGGTGKSFLGYPVVVSQKMPKTEANSQLACLLGNFNLGCKAGEVSGERSIVTSDQYLFKNDQIAIRGKERVAFTCHDVGDTSDAGPIVGLQMASG